MRSSGERCTPTADPATQGQWLGQRRQEKEKTETEQKALLAALHVERMKQR